jgi:hypothetical protein
MCSGILGASLSSHGHILHAGGTVLDTSCATISGVILHGGAAKEAPPLLVMLSEGLSSRESVLDPALDL